MANAADPARAYAAALIDAMQTGVAVYRAIDDGRDFTFVDFNRAAENLSEIKREELLGKSLTEVFPGVEEFGLLAALRRVWQSGRFETLPPTVYNDQRLAGHWYENQLYRLASGEVVALYADVTSRVNAELALRASEERYRLLSESTLDGVFDWAVDRGTLYLSPRWKAQLGYLQNELPDCFETWSERLHPDDKQRVLDHLDVYLAAPKQPWREEFRLRHRDGHYIWMMARATPEIDATGQLRRLLGVHIDINLRHEAEQRFRDLVETSADWVWESDADGRYVYVSPRSHELFGHAPETFTGRRLTELLAAQGRVLDADRLLRKQRKREAYSGVEIGIRHRDGHLLHMESSGTPIFGNGGEFQGYRGIDRDISARHCFIEQLKLYERIVSTTKDLMSFVGRDYRYRIVNDAYARHHGLPIDSIVGMSIAELMSEETFDEVIKPQIDRCFAGEVIHYQHEFAFASQTRHMDVQYHPYYLDDGSIDGAVISVRDITEVYSAKEALRIGGERLALALQAGRQGMFDINLDTGAVVTNDEYAEMLGFDPEGFEESLSGMIERTHPEDRDLVKQRLDDHLNERSETFQIEFRQKTSDGDWKWILALGRVVERDASSRPLRLIGTHTDVSATKYAEERIRQAAKVFSSTAEGVTITDLDGTILDVNDAFCRITGYTRDEVIGKNPRILQSGRHDREFYASMWDSLLRDGHWRGEIWNRRKDGATYPETLTISQVRDELGRETGYVAVFSDITASKQTEEQLQYLAHYDALTELPNRMLLNIRLEQNLERAMRANRKLAVLFIDLDRFKLINDSLGHAAGDDLLRKLAVRLKGLLRAEDTVARISGDEFVVLIDNIGNADAVATLVRKIMVAFEPPFLIADHEIAVTCSIGVSLFPDDGDAPDALLRNADAAMYRAKDDGRNTYQFYTAEMTAAAFEHVFLENALRAATKHNRFALAYQPQIDLASGALVGLEALIRWPHEDQGNVSPARFIPIAENCGLIREIGAWVLDEACRQATAWLDAGLTFGRIAINVSGSQVQAPNFAEQVASTLARHRISPDLIELEITETFIMNHAEQSVRQLSTLRDIGLTISVDDFGTGYSSLAYLKSLPVHKLKIDQSFVRDIPDDRNNMAIAEAVIALGKALDLDIIAEGIETAEQARFLRERGCPNGQGYFFARPADAANTTEYLKLASHDDRGHGPA